ncbi:mycofactocin-coupled SDR family oxidoreductase [Gordonia sp. DT30]|uniref:mycofactocin-coupled SDR family oxidoreductase n=1 Tax=Gordonia sp. DT30 TaxID=3416546 RepID=UPI003CEE4EFC
MKRFEGKVAFITGAARGQGRSHAIKLAEEGADIIALDICDQISTVFYPMATKEDLAETEELVKAVGGKIVTYVGDVRRREDVVEAYKLGVEAFGHVDVVLPNAGIMPVIPPGDENQAWFDGIDTLLTGVWNVLDVIVPGMIERGKGGAIVITSSTAGLSSLGLNLLPGQAAYVAAKHGVVGLMRLYAQQLGQYNIRVNTVHPCGVDTPMVSNDEYTAFAGANPEIAASARFNNALPQRKIEAIDISNAIAYLASDDARYVTGVTFPVDAGFLLK